MADDAENSVTLADLENCNWEELIASASEKECFHYSELFGKKCAEARAVGDRKVADAFGLLRDLTFYRFMPSSATEPFQPTIVTGQGNRTAISDDLTDDNLSMLQQVAPSIEDPEMRARVADVIWDRKRIVECAKLAIDSYLESARRLAQVPSKVGDRPMLVYSVDRVERALRLAQMTDDKDRFDIVAAYMDELFQPMAAEHARQAPRLADLIIEFRVGDSLKYAVIAKETAERAEAQNAMDDARAF